MQKNMQSPFQTRRQFLSTLAQSTLALSALAPATAAPTRQFHEFFTEHQGAFVLHDIRTGRTERYNPGGCQDPLSPCSTFKIASSLIALDCGAIPHPEIRIEWDGTQHPILDWNRTHSLRSAFYYSAVWYYREVARRVGEERMRRGLRTLKYGNQDISGGLTQFWLESSLQISADEQIDLLRRLYHRELRLSRKAQDWTVEMMHLKDTARAALYGKTGTGSDLKTGALTLGWFVGWVESERPHLFALNLTGGRNPSGRTARQLAERILESRGLL